MLKCIVAADGTRHHTTTEPPGHVGHGYFVGPNHEVIITSPGLHETDSEATRRKKVKRFCKRMAKKGRPEHLWKIVDPSYELADPDLRRRIVLLLDYMVLHGVIKIVGPEMLVWLSKGDFPKLAHSLDDDEDEENADKAAWALFNKDD